MKDELYILSGYTQHLQECKLEAYCSLHFKMHWPPSSENGTINVILHGGEVFVTLMNFYVCFFIYFQPIHLFIY